MNVLNLLGTRVIELLQSITAPWWVEIVTDRPRCVYYFGPFRTANEAELAQSGYLEDLQNEGAQGIGVTIKRCYPQVLTDCQE
uniref:DUF1816 domain-containing protein n=1 Tax=Cyanothece sp. (strain PCC 7425 / ATCC 29141) TaxID=395961 RepID=B8HX89_CYAP4